LSHFLTTLETHIEQHHPINTAMLQKTTRTILSLFMGVIPLFASAGGMKAGFFSEGAILVIWIILASPVLLGAIATLFTEKKRKAFKVVSVTGYVIMALIIGRIFS